MTESRTATARALTVLRRPFLAETWKRVAYLLLALPVGALCVPLALAGGPAGRVQRGLARVLLGVEVAAPERAGRVRGLAHAVLSLPLNLVAALVTVYGWWLVPMNLGYPLRPDAHPETDWGGPTLVGAWLTHAIPGGVTFLLVMPWIGRGLTTSQSRLLTALLGTGHAPGPTLVRALLTVAIGGALAWPVVNQL
ncbi:hypothetical protein [Streptomyces johnsoniae]|uniref:Uncharacterized protein n=1 Tax=Streptomyces johnsoniae TaxID=3075532 RepID=A0ABU2SA07_9ACTN|nr:hypothetical protein [Streptomyces sp. DSM 41886]MDT0445811.1 hypothetical protein [Streptomyces sp. DSM 41886]